nr:uncharacterized mitochondrial protein AtMg00810-like [Tanacetum cinerariifolium]
KEVKRIFRYLRGTVNTGLWYTKDSGFELIEFSDVDYAGCKDSFKSTFGGAQFLGENLTSWSSKKQDCTALSTTKAEYVSLSACCAQVLWMQTQVILFSIHSDEWKSFQSQHQTALRLFLKGIINANMIKYKLRGRLLASFQDLEHEVATQESQGGMRFKDNDFKIKIKVHRRANNESKEFPRTQGSKFQEGFI